jgi:hypothetical protein
LFQDGVSWKRIVVLGVLIGLGTSVKQPMIIFLPATLMVLWLQRRAISGRRLFSSAGSLVSLSVLIGWGWVWRDAILLHAALPLSTLPLNDTYAHRPVLEYVSDLFFYRYPMVFQTYWSSLAQWFNRPRATFPVWVYVPLILANIAALIGITKNFLRPTQIDLDQRRRQFLFMCVATIVVNEIMYLALFFHYLTKNAYADFPNQGRYYFHLLPFFTLLFMVGLERLFEGLPPKKIRTVITVAMIVLALYAVYPVMYFGYRSPGVLKNTQSQRKTDTQYFKGNHHIG